MTSWRPDWLHEAPAAWRPGTLAAEDLYAAAGRLAAQARFDERARFFARCWLATQAAHPELLAVFRNTARYLLLVASLVLHHRRDPQDPLSGITAARLSHFFEQVVRQKLPTSATQLKAILAHARLHGLLQHRPGQGDARFRPLEPTPLLNQIFRHWLVGFLRACEAEPGLPLPASPDAIAATPGIVGEVFGYRMAALAEDRFILWQRHAEALAWVLRHDHGYRVFLQLTEATRTLADGSLVAELSAAQLAARAHVSRGTVRNLLRDAAAQGWFAAGSEPGRWCFTPRARATTLDWIALELVWMHGLACAAYERLRG